MKSSKFSTFSARIAGYHAEYKGKKDGSGLMCKVYVRISGIPASNCGAFIEIEVSKLFKKWFGWKNLNENRIQIILKSLYTIQNQSFQFSSRSLRSASLEKTLKANSKKVETENEYIL